MNNHNIKWIETKRLLDFGERDEEVGVLECFDDWQLKWFAIYCSCLGRLGRLFALKMCCMYLGTRLSHFL